MTQSLNDLLKLFMRQAGLERIARRPGAVPVPGARESSRLRHPVPEPDPEAHARSPSKGSSKDQRP